MLKNQIKKQAEQNLEYDESFFDLIMKGGQKCTEMIQVEALIIKGPQSGQKCPIKCKWFNITKENDFIEIDGVNGGFYQLCVDDVDSKIMVQAIPILDQQEYSGMPLIKQTDFIQIDQLLQENVNKVLLGNKTLEVPAKCEIIDGKDIPHIFNFVELPVDILLSISMKSSIILIKQLNQSEEFKYQDEYPRCQINRKTNNQVQIFYTDSLILTFKLNNSIVRDVISMLYKAIQIKNKLSSEQEPCQDKEQQSGQLLLKLDQYIKQIEKQEKEISQLKQDLLNEKELRKQDLANVLQSQRKIEKFQLELQDANREINELKEIRIQNKSKLQFYNQETNLLKSQLVHLEGQVKKLNNLLKQNNEQQIQKSSEMREKFFQQREQHYQSQIDNFNNKNQLLQLKINELQQEQQNMQKKMSQLIEEKEQSENQLNSYIKKCESLIIEQQTQQNNKQLIKQIDILDSPISKNSSKFNAHSEFDIDQLDSNSKEKDDEIQKLKTQIHNLEQTIKSLKLAYEQDMKLRLDGKIRQMGGMGNTQEVQFLQKLANNLAETITEKETALENSKKINRDLLNRINTLEKSKYQQ